MEKDTELKYIPQLLVENDLNENKRVYIDKDGIVTYDNITYRYSEKLNNPGADTASLSVTMAKGKMPIFDEVFNGELTNESSIKDVKLSITCFNETSYVTSFMYDGIGYDVKASRISQEDFIKVLISIIK